MHTVSTTCKHTHAKIFSKQNKTSQFKLPRFQPLSNDLPIMGLHPPKAHLNRFNRKGAFSVWSRKCTGVFSHVPCSTVRHFTVPRADAYEIQRREAIRHNRTVLYISGRGYEGVIGLGEPSDIIRKGGLDFISFKCFFFSFWKCTSVSIWMKYWEDVKIVLRSNSFSVFYIIFRIEIKKFVY